MRYEILGPLQIVDGASTRSLSARKIEVLLATLLVRADQVVGAENLMTEIWGERARDIAGLHVYVSQLRKFLRHPHVPESPVVTVRHGYLLRLGTDALDFDVFQGLVRQGKAMEASGDIEGACAAYEQGLDLWRGPVLDDLRDGSIVNSFACWAEQARRECVERLVNAGLELGRHREFVSYLYKQTEENPLHEAFYRQLMLALHRSGCRADALSVYQSARTVLMDELGLHPPHALQDLHRAILADDPALEGVSA